MKKINVPLASFIAGIALWMFIAACLFGCGSDENPAPVKEIQAVDTFVHPDSNIAAEMEIQVKFDTLKDSIK